MKKIHAEMDITIIMVSHHFPDVLYLANSGAIIKNGRIMQQGKVVFIFEKPNSPFTASFVGMKNVYLIEADDGRLKVKDENIIIKTVRAHEIHHTHMGIRPEDVSLNPFGDERCLNRFNGRINYISINGIFLAVRIQTRQLEFEAAWPRPYLRDHSLEIGKTVVLEFHPEAVHIF